MNNLIKFKQLLNTITPCKDCFDLETMKVNNKLLKKKISYLSGGQRIMLHFVRMVWNGENKLVLSLDDIKRLDSKCRILIANWIKKPFKIK